MFKAVELIFQNKDKRLVLFTWDELSGVPKSFVNMEHLIKIPGLYATQISHFHPPFAEH